MSAVQPWRLAVTRSWAGSAVLALALLTHLILALWRIASLKTWRLSRASVWLLVTGALISIAIMHHFFQPSVEPRVAGGRLTYAGALSVIWPGAIAQQTTLLILVWVHSCFGFNAWLKSEL